AAEAWALGAEAFARGSEVTFARTPSLHTVAHEAAHIIQQRAGVEIVGGIGREGDLYERHADQVANRVARGQSSEDLLDAAPDARGRGRDGGNLWARQPPSSQPPVTQLRRIPPNVRALLTAVGGGKGANFFANEEGALLLIDRAMEELTPAERAKVKTRRLGGLTEAEFNALPRLERRSKYAEAILAEFPALKLGEPTLLDVFPRPGTADVANIGKVAKHADDIFDSIASGARDAWLTQIFGAASLAAAKAKYANARTRMNALVAAKKVVTDRGSGFSEEVEEGGLTDANQISVAPSTIDSPDLNESISIFVHESMHAGNPGD